MSMHCGGDYFDFQYHNDDYCESPIFDKDSIYFDHYGHPVSTSWRAEANYYRSEDAADCISIHGYKYTVRLVDPYGGPATDPDYHEEGHHEDTPDRCLT